MVDSSCGTSAPLVTCSKWIGLPEDWIAFGAVDPGLDVQRPWRGDEAHHVPGVHQRHDPLAELLP
jgi:hypothetical protein